MAFFGGLCIWLVARENHSGAWVALIPMFTIPLVPVGIQFVKKWREVAASSSKRS